MGKFQLVLLCWVMIPHDFPAFILDGSLIIHIIIGRVGRRDGVRERAQRGMWRYRKHQVTRSLSWLPTGGGSLQQRETLRWAAYHGKTNICFLQSRPVICAIPSDSHHLPLLPNSAVDDAWERQTHYSEFHTCHLRPFPHERQFFGLPLRSLPPPPFLRSFLLFFPMLQVL